MQVHNELKMWQSYTVKNQSRNEKQKWAAVPLNQRIFTADTCFLESNYFCIQIQELGGSGSNTRLIALDHLVHSINEKDQP